jgi:hypothetical protein
MNDIFTLAVFAAKVVCLIVFVSFLKPDGSIGAVWTSTNSTDCTKASENAGMWARVVSGGFASPRPSLHCTSGRPAL